MMEASYRSEQTYREEIENLLKKAPKYRSYEIELDTLDYEIYVSPFSSDWFYDTIERLLKRLNIDKKIYTSQITNNIEWK